MQTMNKTVFPLVMAVLTACPVFFSCTEKEQEVPVENKIYEYRFELAGDDTRAYLNDDGVFWELNDHVGLFTPTESLVAAVNTDASPKTIDVQSSTSLAVGTKVYAYYPYVEENTSVSASKVLFPAEQSGGSISAMPLAGIPAEVVTEGEYNGVIRFLNLGSVIDFRVFSSTHNNETVESITLEATEGHVAGTAAIDLTGVSWNATDETADIPELTWADGEGASTVTLTQSAPVAANKDEAIADGNLYMVIAPGTYSGAITVTTDAARYTFPFVEKTFALNGLKRFNLNLDKVERVDRFVTINLEKATELVAGEKYVLVSNGFALVRDGSAVSAAAFDATAMTIAVPTDLQSNVEWTLGTNTDSNNRGNVYDFSNSGYFFGILMNTAQTPYTYSVALNTSKQVATNQTMQNHNVNVETGYVYYRGNSSSQYIYYDTEAQAWTNHAASNGTFEPAYGTKLYKLKDMRAEQQLAYSVDAATYDLGTNTWTPSKPTLSGAQGDVTYNSSDEGVATVSVTGEVTPLKKGTTRITASADGNADYKPGTAFYDLTVINSQTVLVTYYKATQFDSGYQYMIVSGGMALKNAGNGEIVDAESVTVENDQITREEDPALLWTAADAPELDNYYYGTHTLTSGTEHLWRHSNNGNYTVEGSNASVTKYMIWSYEAEKLWNISVYNGNSSTYYTYYDNGWKSVSSSSDPTVKTNIFTARPPQTLSFSPTTAEYDLYTPGAFVKPTLSGYQTTVTFDSSDKTVATVDADGTVQPHSVGTTTIIATAAGTAEYQGATATYELTVINSNMPKYVKAEEMEDGVQYLIVSGNRVLRNNNNSVSANEVVVENEVIYYDAPATDLWTAVTDGNAYNLTNNNRYLRLSSNNSLSISSSKSGTSSNNLWSYDASNNYLRINSRYLYFTNNNFTTSSSAHNAALYVLDDGRQAQEIAFGAADAEYDLGTSKWTKATPALTGAKTTVTYASSDATVATVANDGTVTPLKVGTTTITATASADAQYKKATASYTLSVVNSAVVEKTYNRVSSISAGTYLIMGRETSSGRAGTYVCVFPPSEDNKCDHIKVSDNQELATLTTTSNEYGAYEVELIASGSNWLVKVKSSGQYMYYASSKISFTDDASVAAQQITSNGEYPACIKNTNNDQFYHSGSKAYFMYSNNKNANNLRFFKLSE